jgi:hypothetical protein
MSKALLIKDVTTLAVFEPAIKLQALSADLDNPYFRDYILTQDLANLYERILSSVLGDGWGNTASTLPAERRRSHLISAQYGAGKSYFLLILSALLDAGSDTIRLQTARKKFEAFREVQRLVGQLTDKKFLIIQVSAEDKGDIRLKELLVSNLLDQVTRVLPDATFSNEYTEAISHLEEVDASPIRAAFAGVLEKQFATSLQQLQARLGSYDRDGLRTYYQACEQVLGRKVSRDVLDVEATFQEALDLLKPKGYTHIAVLIDELTAYLSASERHHSLAETLGELQAFAAYCNKPASHCLLVGAMHVSVRDFLQERSMQRDYNKVMGRFDERDFPIYSSKLLAGVFQPKDAFEQAMMSYRGQVRELTSLIETFQMADDGRPMKLSAFFPLHPAVAYYLPRISRVLGQAERTTFGFINEVVRPRLDEPLAIEQRLNLVTLDQVFDYFLPAMEQREHYLQVITAYNTVQSRVSNRLAHRAFKPLALLWIASRFRLEEAQYLQTDLSAEQVADFIGAEDDLAVIEALESLCKTGYVYFDRSTQKYFYSHADPGWDLESDIQDEMAKADANEVLRSELQALGFRVCLKAPDTITVKVDRSVESQWIDIEQLEKASSSKPKRAEGKVVFVVPDFGEVASYDAKFSDVSMKARDLSAANVAVAVPKKVDMLNQAELRRYRALQEIGKRLDAGSPGSVNEHRVRVTRARFSEVQARVQRDVEAFGQEANFIFFINRQPQEAQDLNTILADMFARYYYKFPKVRVERINGRNTTNALIETCIVNPQYTFASDTPEVARQARDTLQVLGLCSWEGGGGGKYKVELKEPEPGSEGYEIWKIVLDTLTDAHETPFATVYRRLEEAPYGLPSCMVELYIAAARALKKVYILDKSNKMPTVSKDLVADITKVKDKGYRVLPVEETEVPYTYICSIWQAIDEPLGLRHYQELEKSLGRTIDDQRIWFEFKADSNNLLQNRLSQVTGNLKAIEAESKPLTVLAKYLEQIRREFVPAKGFEQLAALGEELSGVKVSDDPDAAALAVRKTIEAGEQFLKDWGNIQAAYRQYRQLGQTTKLGRFGALAQAVDEAWQAYRRDALSQKKYQVFIEQFEKLWGQYAEQYVEQHNAVAKARANYGQKVEKSLAYQLVGEFGQFDFRGITTRSSFDDRIKEVRKQGCRPLAEDSVRDYRRFGKTTCSSCGYRLGTDVEILGQLRDSEDRLAASVNNALDGYLVKLAESLASESIQLYVREKATAEQKTTIASAQDLATRGQQLSETQYRKLITLLPLIRPTLLAAEAYVREQAKKRKELERQLEEEERKKRIPRLPTAQLADTVRSFLLDSGLEEMTLKELEERLASWLQEIATEFQSRT